MATKRYRVCYPATYTVNDGEEKTRFVTIGTAFPLKDSDGFTVLLDCVPRDGNKLVLFAVDENEEQGNSRQGNRQGNGQQGNGRQGNTQRGR